MTTMLILLLTSAITCGVERSDVKHGLNAEHINRAPLQTTIEALTALSVVRVTGHETRGLPGPAEYQVYSLEATVVFAKTEADLDVHIVLQDFPATMIVESVDPRCAGDSPFIDGIVGTRKSLLSAIRSPKLSTRALHRLVGRRVRVTGIGFFDPLHGQTGVAPNGIELHPLLSLEVLQ